MNRFLDFVGRVRQLVAGKSSLKTVVVRPPDPVKVSTPVPDWESARLERVWTEKFLNGEITLPVLPYSFNSPTRPAPRNRAERRTTASRRRRPGS